MLTGRDPALGIGCAGCGGDAAINRVLPFAITSDIWPQMDDHRYLRLTYKTPRTRGGASSIRCSLRTTLESQLSTQTRRGARASGVAGLPGITPITRNFSLSEAIPDGQCESVTCAFSMASGHPHSADTVFSVIFPPALLAHRKVFTPTSPNVTYATFIYFCLSDLQLSTIRIQEVA